MDRLRAELERLYFSPPAAGEPPAAEAARLAGPDGRVRAMVLQLAAPADWEAAGRVWQGVQADFELPAPAIAISGVDGYQLWFSLTEPVPAAEAAGFLARLRARYLADVPPQRIATVPPDASVLRGIPPFEAAPGHWSAFVAPDLAALFAEEPWLDLLPGADAQAELLSRLQSTKHAEWKRALERLGAGPAPGAPAPAAALQPTDAAPTLSAALARHEDPRRFLLDVMNDSAVELQLRIEAAKALLPYFQR